MSRSGSKAPDDQVKLKKILDELTKKEENKFCADCGTRGPRWASINLGVFICIACSGIHRSLGVHLTFVRSVNLDSWTSEQVAQMKEWGNARAKEYYEATVPRDYRIPTEHSSVREKEMWIRDKYERKRFVDHNDDRRTSSRKKRADSDEEETRTKSSSRTNSRTNSRGESSSNRTSSSSRRAEPAPAPKAAPVTNDILNFDAFSSPVPVSTPQPAAPTQPAQAPKQDEWAAFTSSSSTPAAPPQGFTDAFAAAPPAAPAVQSKMANIMASFGPAPVAPTPFGAPQGMMGGNPMGGNPMGGNAMMGGMGAPQQGFGNPMMAQGQQPSMMMNPMQNQMFGGQPQQPQQGMHMGMNNMMGGNMGFQGAPQMGFQQHQQPQQHFQQQQQQQPNAFGGNPMGQMNMGHMGGQMNMGMGMNPMGGGMNMNPMGFQPNQQARPPQQPNQGSLNQPFVNLQAGGANPFF
ncbi:TPA: hypothetical protein N0F65_003310 [Lagenidium giganteum]|uniref:Arf-GAP domain-containing protein n=1 Tax=Lagenidium giganteum TaxID=4803 RepID=A0AAV2ZD04_9STRA|nr:TPA: hypothetical protein N0F65_003310 [Lagenidium giganteum]